MKKIMSLLCVLCLIISMCMPVSASNDVLIQYRNHLKVLNQELGTNYSIPNEADCINVGRDYNEVVSFYITMTIEEFENYIKDLYERYGIISEEIEFRCVQADEQFDSLARVAPTTKNKTQKLIFSNENYFAFKTVLNTSEGNIRYSRFTGFENSTTSYPGYKLNANDSSYTFNSDCTSATVNFNATLYVSENLLAAVTAKTFTVRFLASGGDIYELTEV